MSMYFEAIEGRTLSQIFRLCIFATMAILKALSLLWKLSLNQFSFFQVRCPANHRNACNWQGSLITCVSHAAQNKCAQVSEDCRTKILLEFYVLIILDRVPWSSG